MAVDNKLARLVIEGHFILALLVYCRSVYLFFSVFLTKESIILQPVESKVILYIRKMASNIVKYLNTLFILTVRKCKIFAGLTVPKNKYRI